MATCVTAMAVLWRRYLRAMPATARLLPACDRRANQQELGGDILADIDKILYVVRTSILESIDLE
jgi:hypothetical protein